MICGYDCIRIQQQKSNQLFHSFIMISLYVIKRCVYLFMGFATTIALVMITTQENRVEFQYQSTVKAKTHGQVLEPNLRIGTARFDNSRKIRIYEWVWTGDDWDNLTNGFKVCLATQSSLDRLGTIQEVATHWQGPISLAIFISRPLEWFVLQEFVAFLKKCSDNFRKNVAIHLAVPSNFSFPDENNSAYSISNLSCGNPQKIINLLLSRYMPYYKTVNLYPQNHMRNIARKTCGTDWVLATDVDIVPSIGCASLLQEFYQTTKAKQCKKCAYVIPTFELEESAKYPTSKRQLQSYVTKGLARQFHKKVFDLGHKSTNYYQWSRTNLNDGPVKISHPVYSQENNYYEPFYISSDSIPPFDERFIGYGFVRSSQATEARMKGWNFMVLTPIFLIHRGFQENISPRESSNARSLQTARNAFIFQQFMNELKFQANHGYTKVGEHTVKAYSKSLKK